MLHVRFDKLWFCAILFALGSTQLSAATGLGLDTAQIEQLTGLKGTFSKDENVFKVSKPRTDVKIHIDNSSITPFMGLTSWAAFTPISDSKVMLMGDMVLFEDEVSPIMSTALGAGLEVTALHNHVVNK